MESLTLTGNGSLIINEKDIEDFIIDLLDKHLNNDSLECEKCCFDCEDDSDCECEEDKDDKKIELGDIVALAKEPYVQSVVEGMYLEEDRVRFSLKYIDYMFSEEEIFLVSKK